jgi:hypothetical protein
MSTEDIAQTVAQATVIVASTCARLHAEGIQLAPERIEEMAKDVVTSLLKKYVVNLH